jgi:hypothetical protein
MKSRINLGRRRHYDQIVVVSTYLSIEFNDHLKQCGIIPHLTPPGTPVEWCVRAEVSYTIGYGTIDDESGRTTFIFWGYALETAILTLNKVPINSIDKTPYEVWMGRVPNLSFLKIGVAKLL